MINKLIFSLIEYSKKKLLINEADECYCINRILEILGLDTYNAPEKDALIESLDEILDGFCDWAYENGLIEGNSTDYRDLFDTKIMGAVTPFPSTVIEKFKTLYEKSPEKATEYYYDFSKATNYIRDSRVKKDMKWIYDSSFGALDITINLSKPEKDPKAIAAAKNMPSSGYPSCLLCVENEGYAGRLNHPARQNHRIIPITLAGEEWFLQYSPYVYYNEHCISFSKEHIPMKVDAVTLRRALDFVEILPHYFMGSNAGLPVVGGSILTHNHMQGGRYTFAMERAPIEKELSFDGFPDVRAGIVKWPLSVIRLACDSKEKLLALATKILEGWQNYTDEDAFILAETDGVPHNAITPIARRKGEAFELDLVLRNNITTDEYPLGVYHPHPELHNIKKENIGLIEVMGLAVLPARLKNEMAHVKKAILENIPFDEIPEIVKHKEWFEAFKNDYTFTEENTDEILKKHIGESFEKCLEHAGVYKCTPEGREAFMRFINSI